MAYNKIGFYLSGSSIGRPAIDYLHSLDEAGIPFFLTVDGPGSGLEAAQTIARRNPGVAHTIAYHNQSSPAKPDFNLQPDEAAKIYWQTERESLPPELQPDLVWLAPMELEASALPDSDWLGHFAYTLAQYALSDGYRLALPGFSVGTPPRSTWERESMLRFLGLCGRHPDRLAIALQEFSRQVDDIWFDRDENIGRFYHLFATCDRAQLRRPTVLITRWGWTPDRIPSRRTQALADVAAVAELYGRYPEIRGAALWRLGPEPHGLDRQVARLVRPLTELTLTTTFVEPAIDELESFLTPPPMSSLLEQAGPNARFVSDITIPDDSRLTVNSTFTKTWRVENNGSVAWDSGFRLVHAAGEALSDSLSWPVPQTAPGALADLTIEMKAPTTPGTAFSEWRLQDGMGQRFGDVVYTRIEAVPAPDPATVAFAGKFVADVTVPDDSEIPAGQRFVKTWRVRNSGLESWASDFTLHFVGGNGMSVVQSVALPPLAPGEEGNVSVELVAPSNPGVYYADWRMKTGQGLPFGEMVYVRIIVPRPPGSSLVAPLSQRDPLWADVRLGEIGSPKTIGEWGCLLVCLSMTAKAMGKSSDPLTLQERLLQNQGFLDLYLTRWDALSQAFQDVIYDGRLENSPDMLERINASLALGIPVPVHVDMTRDTPYTEFDQHWVLIVGRDGDDYRINDPWLLPAQEASFMERYGQAGYSLRDSIIAALFYRVVRFAEPDAPQPDGGPAPSTGLLERGMNVNPDAPHSNPVDSGDLKGFDWVRFVFKVSARINPAEREQIDKGFAQYDPIVQAYNQVGVKSLIVINQETVWGNAPWTGNGNWFDYARQLADTAGQIAARYRRYGDRVAYQIWNEGDKQNNPASVYVEPEDYAVVLRETAGAIRQAAPQAPILFNGMATGPQKTADYIQRCMAELGGVLPVDAVGIHPYTRWATRAPFDWGKMYGTLGDAFSTLERELPGLKFWITEIGVADDNEIGPQYYADIADYMEDIYQYVARRYANLVPVVIWFAWSDWMRNAGVVRRDGTPKEHVHAAFRRVRSREAL